MEVTDEMVVTALKSFCDVHWRVQPDPRWIGYNRDAMRSALKAALAVKPPAIQVVWAKPVENPA